MLVEKGHELSEESIIEEVVEILNDRLTLEEKTSFNIDDLGDLISPMFKENNLGSPRLDTFKNTAKKLMSRGYEFDD